MSVNAKRMGDIETQLIHQALQDATFRDRLLSDPKAVLAEMGLSIPDHVQVQVLEESPTQYYLVLPFAPGSSAATQLSDVELEAMAGGSFDPSSPDGSPRNTVNTGWTGCGSGQSGCVL